MSVLSVLTRSMREMLWPRRFLPFFLLYMLFIVSAYLALTPILGLITGVYVEWMTMMAFWGMIALGLIAIVCGLVNLWFTGALIYDIKNNCGFSEALKQSKKMYLQIFLTMFILICLYGLTMFFQDFSSLLQLVVDWIFIFALPAVVINNFKFEVGLKRSFEIVKAKPIQTLVFFILRGIVLISIVLVGMIVVILSLAPVILASIPINQLQYLSESSSALTQDIAIQFISNLLRNYPFVLISSIVVAFFGALFQVFNYLARTYYYLEISKSVKSKVVRPVRKPARKPAARKRRRR